MFAYIAARGGSKRIPRKNVKPLGGKPLLLDVLDNLSTVKGLSGIAVSTEDPEILEMAAVPPVDCSGLFLALAKPQCRATVVRAFASGWDWSAKPCCAPRRRTRSGASGGGPSTRSCIGCRP